MRKKNYAKKLPKRHRDDAAIDKTVSQGKNIERNESMTEKKTAKSEPFNKVCPVCGEYTFTEPHDICPVCGWEQDSVQENEPFFAGGANEISLYAARKKWKGETK